MFHSTAKATLARLCLRSDTLSNQSPTSALLRSAGPRCYGDGATAILRSATWVMPPASLRNVRYQPSDSGATQRVFMEDRSQFLCQKNATDPEPRNHIKYATATADIKEDEAYTLAPIPP